MCHAIETQLRTELEELYDNYSKLKTENLNLECKSTDLEFRNSSSEFRVQSLELELARTKSLLRQTREAALNREIEDARPASLKQTKSPLKRVRSRSPSVEILETPLKKAKNENEGQLVKVKSFQPSTQAVIEVHKEPSIQASKGSVLTLINSEPFQSPSKSTPLAIIPRPLTVEVPRVFLRISYGGSDQHFLQFIQPDMNPSGPTIRRIVFPMLDMNPMMPSKPGEHGYVYASRHEILQNFPWTLFCKRDKMKAVWMYLGEYENEICGKITKEQFAAQRPEVKQAWAKSLLKAKGHVNEVYTEMRARIGLRKYGLIPLDNKEKEEEAIRAEVLAAKASNGFELSEEDVIEAIIRGEESIDIIRMTCVKYDHVFANDIAAKFSRYNLTRRKHVGKHFQSPSQHHTESTEGIQTNNLSQTQPFPAGIESASASASTPASTTRRSQRQSMAGRKYFEDSESSGLSKYKCEEA